MNDTISRLYCLVFLLWILVFIFSFDILNFFRLVFYLGSSLNPILQICKLVVPILSFFFKFNSIEGWFKNMIQFCEHTLHTPSGWKFSGYKVLQQNKSEIYEGIEFCRKLKLIMYLKNPSYLLIFQKNLNTWLAKTLNLFFYF